MFSRLRPIAIQNEKGLYGYIRWEAVRNHFSSFLVITMFNNWFVIPRTTEDNTDRIFSERFYQTHNRFNRSVNRKKSCEEKTNNSNLTEYFQTFRRHYIPGWIWKLYPMRRKWPQLCFVCRGSNLCEGEYLLYLICHWGVEILNFDYWPKGWGRFQRQQISTRRIFVEDVMTFKRINRGDITLLQSF